MKLSKRQQGFTLVELMFASFLGFLLILPVFGLLFQSVDIAASLETKAKLNAQARETLDMLGDGVSHGGGVDVFGIRGSDATGVFSGTNIGRDADIGPDSYLNDQFELKGGLLETAKISPINITCLGVGDPFPVCTGAGEMTVNGYLYDDPKLLATRSINTRTRELEIEIIDYVGVARDNTSLQNNREIYRTIYMFNRD